MKKALKYTFWTLGIIILLFFILFMALSILIQKPKFQTWAVQKSSALLSEKFGSKVSVGSVDIKFIKNIELNKIYLEDKNKDTLLYANKINAKVIQKSEGINPNSGTFTITVQPISMKGLKLASGMFAKVKIFCNATKSWFVPYEALLDGNNGKGYVFVTNDKKKAKREIMTNKEYFEVAFIRSERILNPWCKSMSSTIVIAPIKNNNISAILLKL